MQAPVTFESTIHYTVSLNWKYVRQQEVSENLIVTTPFSTLILWDGELW